MCVEIPLNMQLVSPTYFVSQWETKLKPKCPDYYTGCPSSGFPRLGCFLYKIISSPCNTMKNFELIFQLIFLICCYCRFKCPVVRITLPVEPYMYISCMEYFASHYVISI